MLESFQVTDPEGLFISSRDGKPYVIKYAAADGPPGPGGYPVIAYEQEAWEASGLLPVRWGPWTKWTKPNSESSCPTPPEPCGTDEKRAVAAGRRSRCAVGLVTGSI